MILIKPKFWDSSKFSIWSIILFPFSLLYLLFFQLNKIKSSKKYKVPIICVGNIYLGGTGKTPMAIEIYRIFKSFGKNPAFVKKYHNYLEDEIKMLSEKGEVFVSKSRNQAIANLINNKNDIAILDDGFQDFTVEKKFSIVCFNEKQWLGNRMLIPSGPLREKLSSISRADCIIINGRKNNQLEEEIYNFNKKIKIFYTKYKPLNIEEFINRKIIAFAGIGNPLNFFNLLEENNLILSKKLNFPDHYNYSSKDLNKLANYARESNSILLTTEKDYLRIKKDYKKNIKYLKIEIEVQDKDKFINFIKNSI